MNFIREKTFDFEPSGIDVNPDMMHPILKPFQKAIAVWGAKKGRAAIFADTGLGKTFISVEWARAIGKKTIFIAPLSVARQTVKMAADMLDCDIVYVRNQSQVTGEGKLWITNYEMIEHFDASQFDAVVLDESSILKAIAGKTRQLLTDMFQSTPYRLCCTATPAPNDLVEIGNHSEFLGILNANEMKAMFFVHANKEEYTEFSGVRLRRKLGNAHGQEWRLRHHAEEKFYRWMASWAMSIRKPSDLGFDDDGYILPKLNIIPVWIDYDFVPDDQLVFTKLGGLSGQRDVMRETRELRCKTVADLVNASDEQWLVFTKFNPESVLAHKLIHGSVEVTGSDSPEQKAEAMEAFQDGKHRVLVSKPKICGFGMNFQNAHNLIFVGLSYSWEEWYQSIRRLYRFGQTHEVNVFVVLTQAEREVFDAVLAKEAVATIMSEQLISQVRRYEMDELNSQTESTVEYVEADFSGENWTAMLGDSAQRLTELADNSIDLSVYSPPFADLFVYSGSDFDLGNNKNKATFFEHYAYIIREVLRVTKPGRLTCVHTADLPAMKERDGYMGMKDFPGEVIRAYESEGWTYWGYAIVEKNPQAQAIRTKAHALLFATLRKDSTNSRPAILDRVLFFKKDGENEAPVLPVERGEMDNETWIDWAGGIWTGIAESDTLRYSAGRAADDEKHICPLQLGTIERCIKLYSNPGETVLTPFLGIGSEAYMAVKLGRKAIGIELKESYFQIAIQNLKDIEIEKSMPTLFDFAEMEYSK
mgnify:FL=1